MHAGFIDFCSQSHCVGWAVQDGEPALLGLFINDTWMANIQCQVERPDLQAHGFPSRSGFLHLFDRPLRIDDVVDIRYADGTPLGNSPTIQHQERLRPLLEGITTYDRGLELGPLDRPILGKPDYQVLYVDHASQQELIEKYGATGTASLAEAANIREVDIVWRGRLSRSAGRDLAYCLASHVIEHVADPIGWLIELAEVLRPGGRLNLAVPEQTRTFDHGRMPSTPAAMLEANQRKLTRPSFGQIFDHIIGAYPIGDPLPDRGARARAAYDRAIQAERSGEYLDVHCHVWTHDSFIDCWNIISLLGLVPLTLVSSKPAFGEWNEFIVSFVRK